MRIVSSRPNSREFGGSEGSPDDRQHTHVDRAKVETTTVWMTAIRSHFTPDQIEVEEGNDVTIHITSIESADDQTHGFTIDMYNINVSLEAGKNENISFKADMPGTFPMYCTEFCSALHLEMAGYFLVKPKKH